MKHVVQFSGGIGSWAAALLVKERIAAQGDEIVLLFADVLIEDEETYAFIAAASADLGIPITRICVGETPWEVFKRVRYLGNTRVDPCSLYLKREPLRAWIEENCDPSDTVVHLGIDWTEIHRLERARPRWEPWRVEAPLCQYRVLKQTLHRWAREHGLPKQRLYRWGMPHANCGGGCVKSGQAQFIKLLEVFPERYAEWESNEEDVRRHLGKDVSILRERSGPDTGAPLTLAALRERVEEKREHDLDRWDWGGCGCAVD